MSDASRIKLTSRICNDLRIVLRRRSDEVLSASPTSDYAHYRKIAQVLDKEGDSVGARGGVVLDMSFWQKPALLILRELLFDLLKDCTQMQVRRAIHSRIATIEDFAEVSAVERLGKIVQLKVAS